MSVNGLVVKQKLSYSLTGTNPSIPFSMVGLQSDPIQYLGILFQGSGSIVFRVKDTLGNLILEKTVSASNSYEFVILGGNLNLTCPTIYILETVSENPVSLFEMNLATLCLCEI